MTEKGFTNISFHITFAAVLVRNRLTRNSRKENLFPSFKVSKLGENCQFVSSNKESSRKGIIESCSSLRGCFLLSLGLPSFWRWPNGKRITFFHHLRLICKTLFYWFVCVSISTQKKKIESPWLQIGFRSFFSQIQGLF